MCVLAAKSEWVSATLALFCVVYRGTNFEGVEIGFMWLRIVFRGGIL
jgi:hypothetical protein